MIPTLKWKRSNRQLLSSKDSQKTKESSPPTSNEPTPASSLSKRFNILERRTTAPTSSSASALRTLSPALSIPEIVLAIASYLNRSTLARCTAVCREWHHILQPLLFRVIHATDFDQPDFIRAFQDHTRFATSIEWIQEPPIKTSVPKKQAWHHIFRKKTPLPKTMERTFKQLESSLHAGETPSLGKLSVRIQNQDPNMILTLPASTVSSLQISTKGYPVRKHKIYMEDILLAYPHLVHLTLEGLFTLTTHLVATGSGSSSSSPASSTSGGETYIPAAPVATTELPTAAAAAAEGGVTTATGAAISMPFAAVTSGAQHMPVFSSSLSISSENEMKSSKTSITAIRAAPPSGIKTLNLRLVDISQEGLIAVSTLMPKLESLLIEEFLVPDMMIKIYRWNWSQSFIHSLKVSYPHLRSIRMAIPFDTIREDTIVEILKAFPLLTTVGFRNSWFGKRAMETLAEHCPLVESLDVSFGCAMHREFKGALLRFVQTNTRLRELEADGVIFHLDKLMDDDVVRTPWACSKLEKLVCGFQGTGSMIFQHVSQFLEMKSLTVSYPSLSISPHETTLAWMSKCTKMEYFWYSQYRHMPLDKATFQWILVHWPNLKTLHVAGGMAKQGDIVRQWCRDANRQSLLVEYDRV
ncbi:hypothetical protein EMPS_09702 [Entomortierella parvispora]|uniref:F-box domain-containing protein n=1 Tax=Entomortierella parvispora TaxID=205924 RepID=A0A9P3HJ29_9FUNG|nr:hypothetical protein EMPS_09702 [Entomortierella parvispora]